MSSLKRSIGVDIGGTAIKIGIVDQSGKIIQSETIPTKVESGFVNIIERIGALCKELLLANSLKTEDILGIGIGIPGIVDAKETRVVYATNLFWEELPLGDELKKHLDTKVALTNDANAAALGEANFGAGKNYANSVFVTLGTGVGGGIVIDNKLYEGNKSAGAEIGHIVVQKGGELCNCGRRGCFEKYASTTALVRETKKKMLLHRDSKMWGVVNGDIEKVGGKTVFAVLETDIYAREVYDTYLDYLAEGLCDICNVFRPEAIILGGGISKEGERLTLPVKARLSKMVYGVPHTPAVEIVLAKLGNSAGLVGAASLLFTEG